MEIQNKIFVNRTFACSNTELFNWLVKPELIVKWFGPKHLMVGVIETDVRKGGRYFIELIKSVDQSFFIQGNYLEVNPPNSLSFTFQYNGLALSPPKSVVKINIVGKVENESILSLIQEFEFVPSDMENRTEAWNYMFQILDEQLKPTTRTHPTHG